MGTSSSIAARVTALMACFLASCTLAWGQESYSFLDIPSSTLVYGLGGVNITAVEDDVNSICQNPGLLGPEVDRQVGVSYMRYIGESNFAGARFSMRAGEHAAWLAGIQYLGYGKIQGADINGVLTGEFEPKDIVVNGMYAHDITSHWRGGINLKFVYSSYDAYSAVAIATDLGVNYYDPERNLSFSAVVANLGGQVKRFHERYDRLPVDIRLGITKSFGSLPVNWSVTAWNLTKWHLPYYDNGSSLASGANTSEKKDSFASNLFRHLVFAADYVPSERFHIGIGYNYKTRTDMSTYKRSFLSGFSLCGGINVKNFGVGVALAQPHNGATTLMINLSTRLYEF